MNGFGKIFVGRVGALLLLACAVGCVSVDEDVVAARLAIEAGRPEDARAWSANLATNSIYSTRLGAVEAGRVASLAGDSVAAEAWYRRAIDSAVARDEGEPKLTLRDAANTALAATVTDDRTREYYLAPYEINMALYGGILAQLQNGKKDDALADARLSVYVQDQLAKTYGEDLAKEDASDDAQAKCASDQVCARETTALREMMRASRNSWENALLWYLTGVLFEADGDGETALQSYRKALACQETNPVFAAAVTRLEAPARATDAAGKTAKLVVFYEEGLVPLRESVKIPVPIYTAMSIDLPRYADTAAYAPPSVAVSGVSALRAATPALDVQALAARDLSEALPGIVTRNITRAAVQAGAQAAVNAAGNEYAKLAVLLVNATASALRRADTRTWATLPKGVQVWEEDAMTPGTYALGFAVGGETRLVPVTLQAGDVKIVVVSHVGALWRVATASA